MKEFIVQIEGMNCRSCAAKIDQAITAMKGVSGSVDFVNRTATITIDSTEVSIDDVVQIIQRLGYQAASR